MEGAQFDRSARAGADIWDDGQAGVILAEDYFQAMPIEVIYLGPGGRNLRYVGAKQDSEIYLGTKALFP